MYPTPLPPNPFPDNPFQTAYQRCIALEVAAQAGLKPNLGCPPPLVCARLLGHLLRLAPNHTHGREQVQREIMSAADDDQFMEVASVYFNGFIRVFRRSKPTPAPSEHSSRSSMDNGARALKTGTERILEGQLDYRRATDVALCRADYHCMITSWRSLKHHDDGSAYIEAAHIIPEPTNTKIDPSDETRAGEWAILSMFSGVDLVRQLAGNNIHRLENILLMTLTCHHFYDGLFMWLKPVEGRPHTYRVHVVREGIRIAERIPEMVTFSTTTGLPLPDSAYLALHALCCEVSWMSGAIEHIMSLERRMEETYVLANDGSTADVLASALAQVRFR